MKLINLDIKEPVVIKVSDKLSVTLTCIIEHLGKNDLVKRTLIIVNNALSQPALSVAFHGFDPATVPEAELSKIIGDVQNWLRSLRNGDRFGREGKKIVITETLSLVYLKREGDEGFNVDAQFEGLDIDGQKRVILLPLSTWDSIENFTIKLGRGLNSWRQ